MGYEVSFDANGQETVRYYHYDQVGSTVALTDAAGAVTDRFAYDTWGYCKRLSGEIDTPFLYVGIFGIQTDPNGLINMRARYYSPATMSFISADPTGFDGGMNWYLYANGNPLMFLDRLGLYAEDPQIAQTMIVIGYTETPLGKTWFGTPHHAYVIAIDMQTKEMFASRAGPSSQTAFGSSQNAAASGSGGSASAKANGRAGSGGYGYGAVRAESDSYGNNFRDSPTSTVAYQLAGVIDQPYSSVINQMRAYEISVNNSNTAYWPLGPNSNSYAFGLTESLIGYKPIPMFSVPGYDVRIQKSVLHSYNTISYANRNK